MKFIKISILTFILFSQLMTNAQTITPEDGNWAERYVTLTNTTQADLMVRVGDIDNLNFGWPTNFNPFSGNNTPVHSFPWAVNAADPPGTDRIMVITSYAGSPPSGRDGYTNGTSRPANAVTPITLTYDLNGLTIYNVVLQIFVDDFQAPVWKAKYTVTIDNVRVPFIETIINSLSQTGPIGKMISVNIPAEYIHLFEDGEVNIVFDDLTTGAGDGYAIDFVKLLFNTKALGQYSKINGKITVSGSTSPLENVKIVANGIKQSLSASDGKYTLDSIPPGIINVRTYLPGYGSVWKNLNLAAGATGTLDFQLASPAPEITYIYPDTTLVLQNLATSFTVSYIHEMDTNTFNVTNVILSDLNQNLSGKFTRTSTGFTFQPDNLFVKNMTYTFIVTADVKSKAGVNLEKDFVFIYKTQNTTGDLFLMSDETIAVYPNPARLNSVISLQKYESKDWQVQILDVKGIQLYSSEIIKNHNFNIDLSDYILSAGIYFIRINNGEKLVTQKLNIIN